MSMAVDETKPLTSAERRYLLERGQDAKVDQLDEIHGVLEDEDEEQELPPYTAWKHKDLANEAKRRGLDPKGTVATLAARLEKHDEENPEED